MYDTSFAERFGRLVRDKRTANGWSQEALAEVALGNPDRKGFISKIENGKTNPSALTVRKLSNALGLTQNEIHSCHVGQSETTSIVASSLEDNDLELNLARALRLQAETLKDEKKVEEAINLVRHVLHGNTVEDHRRVEVLNELALALTTHSRIAKSVESGNEAILLLRKALELNSKLRELSIGDSKSEPDRS